MFSVNQNTFQAKRIQIVEICLFVKILDTKGDFIHYIACYFQIINYLIAKTFKTYILYFTSISKLI